MRSALAQRRDAQPLQGPSTQRLTFRVCTAASAATITLCEKSTRSLALNTTAGKDTNQEGNGGSELKRTGRKREEKGGKE